jgi:hypothetical protein
MSSQPSCTPFQKLSSAVTDMKLTTLPSSIQVMNEWSCTSNPSFVFNTDRDHFTFTLTRIFTVTLCGPAEMYWHIGPSEQMVLLQSTSILIPSNLVSQTRRQYPSYTLPYERHRSKFYVLFFFYVSIFFFCFPVYQLFLLPHIYWESL